MPQLELVLDSKLESADLAESCLRQLSREMGYSEGQQEEISLAVREAVANAVFHGNDNDPAKKVVLKAAMSGSCLKIFVFDEGKGFDLHSLPNPLDPSNLFRGSGRGIRLMQCLMDEVTFQNKNPGTAVTMIKYLRNSERGN